MPDLAQNRLANREGQKLWALSSRRVVTPSGLRSSAIVISGETIVELAAPDSLPASVPVENVGDRVVFPGLVDTHIHINEPGRTEWECFETATRAAAAGGITTLVDMPLNSSPVTTTVEALARKLEAARGKLWVDCGFYGGVVPGNLGQVGPLISAGVLGFKAFLCHSGIDEFPNATEGDLRAAMPELGRAGLPLLVHAELVSEPLFEPPASLSASRSYRRHLASRPRAWEHNAIRLLIDLCRQVRCHVHILHLSSADALPIIARAREEGLPLTVETCPHYLTFAAEEIPDGDPRYKCAPPIREAENRERLWAGLRAGLIDTIGSDHSPAPPEFKHLADGDVFRAWGGIASLQLALPAVWTEARRRRLEIEALPAWMAMRPAGLVGLADRKGQIAPGFDADMVVFDPEPTFRVDAESFHHRHKATPYEGRVLQGRVDTTYLRGGAVYRCGGFAQSKSGRALLRAAVGVPASAGPKTELTDP
jgi:allantoinase